MAITYADANNNNSPEIKVYRNGVLIGSYEQGPIATWAAGDAEAVFGVRHIFPGGGIPGSPWLDGLIEEARIYDTALTAAEIQALDCRADFDGDGFVTGLDFDAFVAAFEAGDPSSDFDGDGFVTGLDFDAYVAEFEEGCE